MISEEEAHDAAASDELARIEERQAASQQAIGRFMFDFSQMEFMMRAQISDMIGLDHRYFDAVFGGIDFSRLCSMLQAVAAITFSQRRDWVQRFEDIVKDARKLNDKRVVIAHATWVPGPEGLEARHVSNRKLAVSYMYEHRVELEADASAARKLTAFLQFAPRRPDQIIDGSPSPGVPPD